MRDTLAYMLLMLIVVTGCAPRTKPVETKAAAMPETFSASGETVLPQKWWQSFSDPALDQLMEQALAGNFTLRTAWDRLAQAEQIAVQAKAPLLPSVNYQGDVSRKRQEIGPATTYTTSADLGLVASYEVDLWNQVHNARDAAQFDVLARKEDLATAAITLTVNVAKTWYQLAEFRDRVSVIEKQLDTNQKVLDIVTIQFRTGNVTAADVFRQRQLVESSRGQLIQAQEQVKLLQNRLSVLIGVPPETAWENQSMDLIELPDLPKTGVPAEVIQQRPDVASALYAVQAADQRAAVAIASQYPSLTLTSNLQTTSSRVEDLFDDWWVNLAAGLTGPLFDANRRKAEAGRTRAVLSQTLNQYRQIVLDALQEVEDALTQEDHQRRYVSSVQEQLNLARQTYERTYQRYLNGQLDYLRVLDSLVSQQQLEQSELTARRTLIERRIDLCRALAGSWDMQRPLQAWETSRQREP